MSAGGNEKADMQFHNSRYSGQYWNQRNVKYTSEASALEASSAVFVGWVEVTTRTGERTHERCCFVRIFMSGDKAADCFLLSTYFLYDLFHPLKTKCVCFI